MKSRHGYGKALREARDINPRHYEFPCWCLRCGSRWSIFRAPGTPYAVLHNAAIALHCDLSPTCEIQHVRVARPVLYGETAPEELEEHVDSPFVQARSIGGPDHPEKHV
jgi:hypothetical protein